MTTVAVYRCRVKEHSWLNDLWFSPAWVFMKYVHLLRQIDFDEDRIRREGRFKKVKETLAAANLALVVQSLGDTPVYVQLSATDPPDFFMLQETPGTNRVPWITYVEHTSFDVSRARLDLAGQLGATKLRLASEHSYDYILLVETDGFAEADVEAIRELIAVRGITYKVWITEGRLQDDDEYGRVVALNSPFEEIKADLNSEAERFPTADGAFVMKLTEKDTKAPPPGQPAPWPDPLR